MDCILPPHHFYNPYWTPCGGTPSSYAWEPHLGNVELDHVKTFNLFLLNLSFTQFHLYIYYFSIITQFYIFIISLLFIYYIFSFVVNYCITPCYINPFTNKHTPPHPTHPYIEGSPPTSPPKFDEVNLRLNIT